jgi:adenine-specific DNA-methyltransferase
MESGMFAYDFNGRTYPHPENGWATTPEGMDRLRDAGRLMAAGTYLRYVLYEDDYPVTTLTNPWHDTSWSGFAEQKLYVVQTNSQVLRRCILMTTDPGDLVLDPTCGSGTTAYVAEQWGRRWVTVDTSRVPLALARQRLLTATFPYYELTEEARGPAGGFVYKRKQNKNGEHVGGIIPHVTLSSIANDEPSQEEVLVDRPEPVNNIVRVAGPFTVEATIPLPIDLDKIGKDQKDAEPDAYASYVERMLEVLRKSPILQVGGGKAVTLKNVRTPAKSLALSAEAVIDNGNGKVDAQRPVAIVFGPENGAVSERLVFEAAREAHAKNFTHIYIIGFAIQANARSLIESCEEAVGISATYVQATPDLMMGDLLKTTRASEIFSVCGMPEIRLKKLKPEKPGDSPHYQAELLGLDVFDATTMELDHRKGDDVPAWMLDVDYNGLVFHGSQVFFPRTGAWDNIKKALKATHEESVWDHLAGAVSAPFSAGEHAQVAVKVIDDRGNELLVVKNLKDAIGN